MAINFQAISDALANDMNNMHSQEITTFQNNQPYMENPQDIPPPRQDDFRAYNNYYTNDYTSGYEFFVQGQQYGYPSYSGGMHVTHQGFTQWAGFTTTTPSTAATRNPTAHTVNTIRHVNSLRTMQQDGTVYEQHTNFEVQAEMDGRGNCVGILGWQWDDAVASNVDDGNQGLAESRAYTPQEYDGVQDNYGRTWESTSTSNNTSTEQVEDHKKLNISNTETLEPERASDDEKKREYTSPNDCNIESADTQQEEDMTSDVECDDIEIKFTSPNDGNTPSGDTVQVEDDKLNISIIGTEQEHASDDETKRECTSPNDCNIQSADTQQEEDMTSDVECDDIERLFTSPNDGNTPSGDTVQEEDTTSDVECEDIEIKFPLPNNGNTPSADIVQVEEDKKSDAGSDDLDSGNYHTPAKDHGQGHEVTRKILSPHDTHPSPVESAEQIENSHLFDDQTELPEDSQVINNPSPSLFKRIKRRFNIFTGFIASQVVNAFVKNHVLL